MMKKKVQIEAVYSVEAQKRVARFQTLADRARSLEVKRHFAQPGLFLDKSPSMRLKLFLQRQALSLRIFALKAVA